MKINKDILLECINYTCEYDFINVESYCILKSKYIMSTVSQEINDRIYKKTIDITIDEYNDYVRKKKLHQIINKIEK